MSDGIAHITYNLYYVFCSVGHKEWYLPGVCSPDACSIKCPNSRPFICLNRSDYSWDHK